MIRYLCLILFLLLNNSLFADEPRFELVEQNNRVSFDIKLGDHRIYWIYPGDSGKATTIDLFNSTNLKDYRIVWPFPISNKTHYLENYYTGNLSIPVYLSPEDVNSPIMIDAELNYLLCKEQCIPIHQLLKKTINISSYASSGLSPRFRVTDITAHSQYIQFIAHFVQAVNHPEFEVDPGKESNFIKKITSTRLDDSRFMVTIRIDDNMQAKIREKDFDIYSNLTEFPEKIIIPSAVNELSLNNLILIFSFAVTGGIILNFMPCVLPVLSLKMISFVKSPHNSTKSLSFTILGIMFTFLILAITTILLKNSGKQFGFGVNFQQPEFIIFLAIIVTIFISATLDRINIQLPSKAVNYLAQHQFENYYLKDFASGVLASLLSTPCTAPFLGTAMALALTGSNSLIFIVFLAISLGFSSPYIMMIAFPKLHDYFPKPGKWMLTIKKIVAVLLVLTLSWLLSIVFSQIGIRAMTGFFCLLILLKFIIENNSGIFSKNLVRAIALAIVLTASFYLPQSAYLEDLEYEIHSDNVWQNFDSKKITSYLAEGKIVVVDITADWCVTCKFNKIMVWDREKTISLLSQKNLVALRGNYTNYIQEIYDFLKSNNSYGIPFNAVYGPKGIVILPVLVSYDDVSNAIKKVK